MLRKYAHAIAARAASASLSLAGTSFVAHQLGRPDLGIYLALLGLGQIVASGMMLGLDATPPYLLRVHARFAGRLYWVFSLLSLIFAAVAILLYWPLASFGTALPSRTTVAPFVYAATTILMTVQLGLLQGLGRFLSSQIVQVLFPCSFLSMSVLYRVYYGLLSPGSVVALWAVAGALCTIVGIILALPGLAHAKVDSDEAPSLSDITRSAFSFGAAAYIGGLVAALNARLPAILAPLVIGKAYNGHFAGVLFLHDLFGFFSFAIVSITMSSLAGITDKAYRLETIAMACRANTALTAAAMLGLLTSFPMSIPILLGRDYGDLTFFGMILCIAPVSVMFSTTRILCSDFASQGRPSINMWLNLISIVTLCAAFPLAARAGEWGALLAFIVANVVFSGCAVYYYARTSDARLVDFFVPRREEVEILVETLSRLVKSKLQMNSDRK